MTLLAVCLCAGGCAYFFFWHLPAQNHAAIANEIVKLDARFEAHDFTWTEKMTQELLASGRVRDRTQLLRLEIILKRIREARAGFRCSVAFDVLPNNATASLVDGRRIESGASLPVGRHAIEFKAPGYENEKRQITLEADGQIAQLGQIRLKRLLGRLKVSVEDTEVRVSINQIESDCGIANEFTPVNDAHAEIGAMVPTGLYRITWSEDGAVLRTEDVTVKAGAETLIQKRFGTVPVTVQSDPPGATLWVEGEKRSRGLLPQKLNMRPVRYRLTAQYEDWPVLAKDILFQPGEKGDVYFGWEYVAMVFDSDPPNARIYDGAEEIGVAPFQKVLLAGHHRFAAKLPLLDAEPLDVTLKKGHPGKAKFQFIYGTVRVESDPSGAEICLPGVPKDKWPHCPRDIYLRPGPFSFTMALPGFQTVKVSNQASLNRITTIKAKFERP